MNTLRSRLARVLVIRLSRLYTRIYICRAVYQLRWQYWLQEQTVAAWRFWFGWRYPYRAFGLVDWLPGAALLFTVWMLLGFYALLVR